MKRWSCRLLSLAVVLLVFRPLLAAEPSAAETKLPDLSEFRTVEKAVTTRISRSISVTAAQPAYLGIQVDADEKGRLLVAQVEPDSAAARAGLQVGDELREVSGQALANAAALRDWLHSQAPGDTAQLKLLRKGDAVSVSVTLDATSHPLSANAPRAVLGIQTGEAGDGLRIEAVSSNSGAADAGLKKDDVILKIDGQALAGAEKLRSVLGDKKPGDIVKLLLKREGKDTEVAVKLGADRSSMSAPRWDDRTLSVWRKDVYRLAVVPIEYPDVTHNDKVSVKDWQEALFSEGTYTGKSATGQPVYGSLNDYYLEQSCKQFHVEGKVFPFVAVSKKRAEYNTSADRFTLFREALDQLLERDGKDALKEFDGIFFLYAGDRFPTSRGSLYWPHRASFNYKGQRWAYFICPEGGPRMSSISVIAHEFGHMLGLPDLYARPENPNSEGLGIWCTMSTGHGRDGKPLHFCAWCKEQLGWLKPAVIDPTVKQKLILSPVEGSARECFKVLIQPDGSEYLLLENRVTKGFDRDLPGEGLLIWRVVDGKPLLEESHGITTADGPARFLGSVPFPSKANHAFTPLTTPSSKSVKGGGLPVYITNIHRLPDGRITFYVGYEFL